MEMARRKRGRPLARIPWRLNPLTSSRRWAPLEGQLSLLHRDENRANVPPLVRSVTRNRCPSSLGGVTTSPLGRDE